MTQYSKKMKLFQKEINGLKQENNKLRVESDQKFQENMDSYNQKMVDADTYIKECREL